jgi:integrase
MARRVKDATLDSREARGRLKPRGKPYWRTIERGLHLGYRRLKDKAGTWCARHYVGERQYEIEAIGNADDMSDADGVAILSYWEAQTMARERMVKRAHAAVGKTGPLTVGDAMAGYIEHLEAQNIRTASDARSRDRLFIRPALGKLEVDSLKTGHLQRWHASLGKSPRYVRAKIGGTSRQLPIRSGDDGARMRKATANRTLVVLKAALNRAWRTGMAGSDKEWRRVKPFKGVDAARTRYLAVTEAKRLINGCDPEFRPVVQAALQTGCRWGELIRLQVHDFNTDSGTVAIRQSKSGKPRHVVLTNEGIALFGQLTVGRSGHEPLLRRKDGSAFRSYDQTMPMKAAVRRAGITPAISFHGLRHTWASLATMNGVPLMVVARNLGHSDTRMVEKHYGHLAPSYIAEAIRAGAPRFGFKPDKKVVGLTKARA